MAEGDQMFGGSLAGADQRGVRVGGLSMPCDGQCARITQSVLETARTLAAESHLNITNISKRFQLLKDVASSDVHQQSEIALENAVAIYEELYGQEHPAVARLLQDLSALYRSHGNSESADYLAGWANDILQSHRDEPTHEFFHLFGMTDQSMEAH